MHEINEDLFIHSAGVLIKAICIIVALDSFLNGLVTTSNYDPFLFAD